MPQNEEVLLMILKFVVIVLALTQKPLIYDSWEKKWLYFIELGELTDNATIFQCWQLYNIKFSFYFIFLKIHLQDLVTRQCYSAV